MSSGAWFFLAGLVIGAALGLFVAAWCMAVGDAGERSEQLHGELSTTEVR